MIKIKRETAGEDLIDYIIKNDLTQKKIAEGTGLTETTISRIVSGKTPNTVTLRKLNNFIADQNEMVQAPVKSV